MPPRHPFTYEEFAAAWREMKDADGSVPDLSRVLGMPLSTVYEWRRRVNRHLKEENLPLLPPLRRQNAPGYDTNWKRVAAAVHGDTKTEQDD